MRTTQSKYGLKSDEEFEREVAALASRVDLVYEGFHGFACSSRTDGGKVIVVMDHSTIDARSLAFGELTARRLRERPELLGVAREQLARWQRQCAPNVQAALREWQTILETGLDETIAVLTGSEERHVRLRQSAPFAGEKIISREERQAIMRRFVR